MASKKPRSNRTFQKELVRIGRETIETSDGRVFRKKEAICQQLYNKALKGDVKTIQFIIERIEGKPFQQIDMTTKGKEIKQSQAIIVQDAETKRALEEVLNEL